MEIVIVLVGLVAGGAAVLATIALHRGREIRDLRERIAALEVEVGRGPAHEEHTGGLPRREDRTLRGRMAAAEGAIERAGRRIVEMVRRRRAVRKA